MANALGRAETERLPADEEPVWDAVPAHVEDAPTARVVPFADRLSAGALLGQALVPYARTDAVVLGIANGGLAVAEGVAQELQLALDVWLVRRLSPLRDPSLAIGVISEGPSVNLDRGAIARSGLANEHVRSLVRDSADQLVLDAHRFRGRRPALDIANRTLIVVDDGIASAAIMSAAIDGVRRCGASFVVVASPVGALAAVNRLEDEAEDVACLMMPDRLWRVGAWYREFSPVSDLAVMKILASVPLS